MDSWMNISIPLHVHAPYNIDWPKFRLDMLFYFGSALSKWTIPSKFPFFVVSYKHFLRWHTLHQFKIILKNKLKQMWGNFVRSHWKQRKKSEDVRLEHRLFAFHDVIPDLFSFCHETHPERASIFIHILVAKHRLNRYCRTNNGIDLALCSGISIVLQQHHWRHWVK